MVARLLAPVEADEELGPLIAADRVAMLGTSGTVTTLAAVHLDLPRYDRKKVDGLDMTFVDIRAVSRQLNGLNVSERAAIGCIGSNRADLVLAGCAILEGICATWPVGRLRVADRGLREGILLGLMGSP